MILHDEELRSNLTFELRHKYNELFDENSDATEQCAALVQAKNHAAEVAIPVLPKGKLKIFQQPECNGCRDGTIHDTTIRYDTIRYSTIHCIVSYRVS